MKKGERKEGKNEIERHGIMKKVRKEIKRKSKKVREEKRKKKEWNRKKK